MVSACPALPLIPVLYSFPDMHQYPRLFYTTRLPRQGKDELKVCAAARSYFYSAAGNRL